MIDLKTREKQFSCPHSESILFAWEEIDFDVCPKFLKLYYECPDCGYISVVMIDDPEEVGLWINKLGEIKKINTPKRDRRWCIDEEAILSSLLNS